MRSRFPYYVAWVVAAYFIGWPLALFGAAVFYFLPTPDALFRRRRYAKSLAQRLAVNPRDATARRELARIYLEAKRPKRALDVLREDASSAAADPELAFLLGLALHRSGRHEEALEPLVRSVADRPIHYGEPYRVAGDALRALGRLDEALDAYDRYADLNRSDARVRFALARVHHARGEREETRSAIRAGLAARSGTKQRRHLSLWLEGHWLRAVLLRDAAVIVVGVGAVALASVATAYAIDFAPRAYAHARGALMRGAWWALAGDEGFDGGEALSPLLEAMARCGTQSTGPIREGEYEPVPPDRNTATASTSERVTRIVIRAQSVDVYTAEQSWALCLTRVRARTSSTLASDVAIFIGSEGDEDDVILGRLSLEQRGERVHFRFGQGDSDSSSDFDLILRPKD